MHSVARTWVREMLIERWRRRENRLLHGLRDALLAACSEERLNDGGALGGEDARGDCYLMVEARVGEDFEAGAHGAALGIVGAVDEARDTGLDDGARAHAARLDRDVERGVGKAIVAEKAGGFAKSDNFGVGSGGSRSVGRISRAC